MSIYWLLQYTIALQETIVGIKKKLYPESYKTRVKKCIAYFLKSTINTKFIFVTLGIKLIILYMIGKWSTTELYSLLAKFKFILIFLRQGRTHVIRMACNLLQSWEWLQTSESPATTSKRSTMPVGSKFSLELVHTYNQDTMLRAA